MLRSYGVKIHTVLVFTVACFIASKAPIFRLLEGALNLTADSDRGSLRFRNYVMGLPPWTTEIGKPDRIGTVKIGKSRFGPTRPLISEPLQWIVPIQNFKINTCIISGVSIAHFFPWNRPQIMTFWRQTDFENTLSRIYINYNSKSIN